MEFGPEIKVSGRPDWLRDDEVVCPAWGAKLHWYPVGDFEGRAFVAVHNVADWHNVTAISLPADHPHYAQALAEHALEAQYKGDPLPLAVPTVTLPIMTSSEVRGQCEGMFGGFNSPEHKAVIKFLKHLGVIPPETDVEKFAATGINLDEEDGPTIAEAAIKWARGNS